MQDYKLTCPNCQAKLTADDEKGLMQKVHDHAHDVHGMHMNEQQIKELIASRSR